jgi:hypothetical protein
MNDDRAPNQKRQHPADAGRAKKPYQKPAFRYERVFETQALSCGKVIATLPLCQSSTKTS